MRRVLASFEWIIRSASNENLARAKINVTEPDAKQFALALSERVAHFTVVKSIQLKLASVFRQLPIPAVTFDNDDNP